MSYSAKQALQQNIEAIRIVLESEGKKLTTSEIEKVKRFSGWSNKIVLYDVNNDSEWETASKQDIAMRPLLKELHNVLLDNLTGKQYRAAIESIRNACLTSYFTPRCLPDTFYSVLQSYHRVNSLYEPSGGCGAFVDTIFTYENPEKITIYEKDYLTGRILKAIYPEYDVQMKPFEESYDSEDDRYSAVCSNIPYGQMPVFDSSLPYDVTSKIHNYFFAKGLEKLQDGGVLAYLVSSAFLDTKSNSAAREYLFSRSDFISIACMPDNLMKEYNTEAPSHFIVVRKRVGKTEMSSDEKLLCESKYTRVGEIMVPMNCYIAEHPEIVIGDVKAGKNQYGKPSREVWWTGDISGISGKFADILHMGFSSRYHTQEECQDIEENKAQEYPESQEKLLTTKDLLHEGEMLWDDQVVDISEELDDDEVTEERCPECHSIYDMCTCKESYAPGSGNDIVWDQSKNDDTPPWENIQLVHNPILDTRVNDCDNKITENTIQSTIEDDKVAEGVWQQPIKELITHADQLGMGDSKEYGYTVVPGSEQLGIKMTYVDGTQETIEKPLITLEELEINIPYKQGMIVKRVTPDGLFDTKSELVKVQSLTPLVVEPLELSKSDTEKMKMYIDIRDTYQQLEQSENQ